MGLVSSLMATGIPSTQTLSLLMGMLHNSFIEKEIATFEAFHHAILDIIHSFNSALGGKHYDVPSQQEMETLFTSWKQAGNSSRKKQVFIEFFKNSGSLSKLDDSTLITGLVTVAVVAKKAGENVAQLKMIKDIPDVVFVPSATLLAFISVKLSRKNSS